MELRIPKTSLVVLCGAAGCGKSTFASKHFKSTEIVSSDRCRAIVSDDEENMESSKEAFELFYFIIQKRMNLGRLVVADSTAITYDARKKLRELGESNNYTTILIAFDVPLDKALERNNMRDRKVSEKVIKRQYDSFKRSLKYIRKESFDQVILLKDDDMNSFSYAMDNLNVRFADQGPFDVISDIHGCCTELEMLLDKLGYRKNSGKYEHPGGRKVIFAGDIVDRGPRVVDTIYTVINMVSSGSAYYIPGNHCNKFYRYLSGRKVQVKSGLEVTVEEFEKLDRKSGKRLKEDFMRLYENAPTYLILDDGNLVVAHAGIREDMIGKVSKKITDFVLYGDVTGEMDEQGFPVRGDWASDYCGKSLIVYGHTPVSEPVFINNTINIDQGASIGGSLTALRYPENQIISVKALGTYYTEGRQRSIVDRNIDTESYLKPTSFKSRDDCKVRLQTEELKESLNLLISCSSSLSWVVYVPPVIPGINNKSIKQQAEEALRLYMSKGINDIIVEPRRMKDTHVIVICRDENISESYFSGDRVGELYSPYNKLSLDENLKQEVIKKLQDDFRGSGYFEHNNTEFVIIEVLVYKEEDTVKITPVKLISHSCVSFLNKDNIWHMENNERLCEHSELFVKNRASLFQRGDEAVSFISNALEEGYDNFIIMPVNPLSKYKCHMIQPEILCSSSQVCGGEGSFMMSMLVQELCNEGIEKFLSKKLSKKYFEFIIGCVTINNRILRMRV